MTSRRTRRVQTALALMALLASTGCGGDADDGGAAATTTPAATVNDGTVAATEPGGGDDADGATSTDGSGDGADFSIPAPDGLVLDALVDAGLDIPGQRQLYYPDEDFDRVVAFYDDWTGQEGEWARTEVEGVVVYQQVDGEAIRIITITPDEDAGAQAPGPLTFVLLVGE